MCKQLVDVAGAPISDELHAALTIEAWLDPKVERDLAGDAQNALRAFFKAPGRAAPSTPLALRSIPQSPMPLTDDKQDVKSAYTDYMCTVDGYGCGTKDWRCESHDCYSQATCFTIHVGCEGLTTYCQPE